MDSDEANKQTTADMDTSFGTNKGYDSENQSRRSKNGLKRASYFKRLWHDWADDTTLHGIKFIFGESAGVRRVYWFIIFLLFVGALCYMAVIQSQRFYEYKTVTQTSIIMEDNPVFPAVTICNFNLIKNESVTDFMTQILLKTMYLDDQWNTEKQRRLQLKEVDDDFLQTVSIRKLFLNGSPTLETSIKKCRWIENEIPCEKVMVMKPTEYGFCFTFEGKEFNLTFNARTTGSKAGVQFMLWVNQSEYYIADEDTAGFKIIIHERKEEPDLSQSLLVGPGHSYHIALSKEEKIFLPHPVHAFGTRKCTDLNDVHFKNPLEFFDDYTLYACMRECRSKFTYMHCNCSGPFDVGNFSECRPLEILSCVKEAAQIFNTQYDVDACECPLPCHVTKYNTKVTSAYFPFNNWWTIRHGFAGDKMPDLKETRRDWQEEWLQVKIFFDSLETVRHEQILRYTQEDLVASFGGFLGLFVGASLITLLEILELLVISAYRFIRNK